MKDGLLMKYFVLKPAGDSWHAEASRAAMRAYAEHVKGVKPILAANLLQWVENEEAEAEFQETLMNFPNDKELGS